MVKWEFESILDSYNERGLQYLVQWKDHAPSWQLAADLKGCDDALDDCLDPLAEDLVLQ